MNLNQLLYFCAVVKTGNYTRAAEATDVSEPVVHRAVHSLEQKCGLKLFKRRGKTVSLTPQGEAIYRYAEQIASLADMADQVAEEQKGHISGRLSLGVGITVVAYFLPAILPKWMEEHPLVQLSIVQGQAHELQQAALDDRLDLIICAGMKWDPRLQRQFVFSDKLVVVSSAHHPLSQRDFVTLSELSKEKMILPPPHSSIRGDVEEVAHRYGVRFKVGVEVSRLDPAVRLCEAGVGIAVLPESVALAETPCGRLSILNVEGFPRSCPYFLGYRPDKVLTREMTSFLYTVQLWIQEREHNTEALPGTGGSGTKERELPGVTKAQP